MEREMQAKKNSCQSTSQSSTRPFRGFGSFKVEAGKVLTKTVVTELSTVMELQPRFMEKAKQDDSPGLCLLNELEQQGKIKVTNIDYLLTCLADRAINYHGLKEKIMDIFRENCMNEDIENKENVSENEHRPADVGSRKQENGKFTKTPRQQRKPTKKHREHLQSPSQIINYRRTDKTSETKLTIKYYDTINSYCKVKKKPRMSAKKQLDLSSEDDEKNSWRDESGSSDSSSIE